MDTPIKPLDPREMRKRILRAAHQGISLDDSKERFSQIALSSSLMKRILIESELAGFSDEDTMTFLAYFAFLEVDRLFGIISEITNCSSEITKKNMNNDIENILDQENEIARLEICAQQ